MLVVVGADLGTDGKASGYGQAQPRHLRKIGALAAQKLALGRIALIFLGAEQVYVFFRHRRTASRGRVPMNEKAFDVAREIPSVVTPLQGRSIVVSHSG